MEVLSRPRLRPLEIVPVGPKEELLFAMRDPEGVGETIVVPYGAALLAALMDGRRTLAEIQEAFKTQLGIPVSLVDLKRLVARLEQAHLLEGEPFESYRRERIEQFLSRSVRPAAHAGGAYAAEAGALRAQLAMLFAAGDGTGMPDPNVQADGQRLCGIVSPHIDLHRGGPTFARAYKRIAEQSKADLFVIFGTAHHPMRQLFCATRKDFDTPLGIVRTHRPFLEHLAGRLAADPAGRAIDLFADEWAHRHEHSIEFQAVFLQYVLGPKRPFFVVPIFVGSFHEFIGDGVLPDESPQIVAFVKAVRAVAEEYPGRVCFISGADLAHIGPRFGDEELLDENRLAEQAADDHQLLEAACRGDGSRFFRHVAQSGDRSRICGLSPTYVLLRVMAPARGELLHYDQAVEPDGTSCVSFASLAFYRT